MAETRHELKALLANWSWLLDPADYALLAVSPFGDLNLRDRSGAICLLDVNMGQIVYATEPKSDLAKLFPFAFDDKLAAKYRGEGFVLSDGKCCGYKFPAIAAESSYEPSNVYVADLVAYVSFLGDLHRQLQHVEDGTKVELKVINLPN